METVDLDLRKGDCIKISTLPWVKLTFQDMQLMASAERALHQQDKSAIRSSCQYLSDLMVKDYPAEVFLQRTGIVHALFTLLTMPEDTWDENTIACVVQSLDALAKALNHRVHFYLHPEFYCTKEEHNFLSRRMGSTSSLSSTSLMSQTCHDPVRDDRVDPLQCAMQDDGIGDTTVREQLTVPNFCAAVLRVLLPLLRTSPITVVVPVVKALLSTLSVLEKTVTSEVMLEASPHASMLKQDLQSCLQELSFSLNFHRKCSGSESRLLYVAISVFTGKFLNVVVGQNSKVLPVLLVRALQEIVLDESIRVTYPAVHSSLLEYACASDPTFANVYKFKDCVSQAMTSACKFLKMCQLNLDVSQLSMFYKLFDDALPCLPYLPALDIVREFVTVYSEMFACCNEATNAFGQQAFLKLLKHADLAIRREALRCCIVIIKPIIPLDSATSVSEVAFQSVKFLLQKDIIAHIVSCGLTEWCPDICESCKVLLTTLLHSRWLLATDQWKEVLLCFAPVLPLLQCYAGDDTAIGSHVLALCNPDTVDGITLVSPLECLMSNLRNMFSADENVRRKSSRYLLRLLTEQSDVCGEQLLFEIEDKVKGLENIFCLDSLESSLLPSTRFPVAFQVNNLMSLFTVANDAAMDMEIRTSSLQQISVLLEDKKMQPHFEELGGDELVKNIFEDFARHADETIAPEHMVLCALRILKTRLIFDADFRLTASRNEFYCFTLLKCFFLLCSPTETVFPVIFATLAFSNFLAKEVDGKICLPSIITKRLHLPFMGFAKEPDCEDRNLALSAFTACDSGPLCRGFLLTWALLWYGGKLQVVRAILEDSKLRNIPCYNIIEEQVHLLKATCPRLASGDFLLAVMNATRHIEALHATSRLHILALAVSLSHENVLELDTWKKAFDRFLKLSPASAEDAELLGSIFSLLETVLHGANDPPEEMLQWLWHYISLAHGPCQQLLPKLQHFMCHEEHQEKFGMLSKGLLSFLEVLVVRSQKSSPASLKSVALSLVVPLRAASSPQFYNAVLFEKLLSCLCHALSGLSHSMDAPSAVSWEVSLKILPSLLEAFTTFHCAGNTSLLCMGPRVTRLAAICLHRLADVMSANGTNQWELHWVQQHHRIEALRNLGLSWFLPLWTDPDPQIRAAGLGMAVSLTSTLYGQKLLTTHLEQLVGGVWGAALSFLLDHEEASIVREQAALLLCNSTSKLTGDVEPWQGPHVRNADSGAALYGPSALQTLLQQCGFYQGVTEILYCYCPASQLNYKAIADLIARHGQQLGVTELCNTLDMDVAEPVSEPPVAICTPSLIEAVCLLLQNLVTLFPQQATAEIHEHQIAVLLLRCIAEQDPSLFQRDMHLLPVAVMRVLTQCIQQSKDMRKDMLTYSNVFDIIFSYIGKEPVGDLSMEIWKFSSVILEYEGEEAYRIVLMYLAHHWKCLGEWLTDLVKNNYQNFRQDIFFGVICQLCLQDWKSDSMFEDHLSLPKLLDVPIVSPELDEECGRFDNDAISTVGGLIVLLITKRVKGCLGILSQEKDGKADLALTTLSSVLSVSETAKNALYSVGLFEMLVINIRHLSSTAKECLHMESGNQASKMNNVVTQALSLRFELLQNAVMQSPYLKELCCCLGVPLTILQLWWFISCKASLLSSCLKFVLNLTAECLPACQSLTKDCVVSGGTTLSHHLVLLAQQEMKRMPKVKDAVMLRLTYGILGNLSLSENLQKFLSKVNFLDQIVSLSSECEAKGWQLQMQQTLWLKMLITLSSSAEGQKLVGTTKGILTLLCEWASPSEKNGQDVRWNSMLVIRNLCFLTANKAKLLATEKFLKVLESQLEEPTSKQCLLVASTLWALLSNYQKAKAVILGKKLLCARIYATYQIAQSPHGGLYHQVAEVLQTVIGILERKD